jgi:hypothetical protein
MSGREATRLTYGLVLLVAPGRASKALTGLRLGWRGRMLARILGARAVLQAIVVTSSRGRAAPALGGVADRMHAGFMLCVAVFFRRRRRLALADTAVASLFALAAKKRPRATEMARPATGPPAAPAPTGDGSLPVTGHDRRREAARTQRAIRDVVDKGTGQPVATVKADLVAALERLGVDPPPQAWLDAVASDAAVGHIYVVSERAMADTGMAAGRELARSLLDLTDWQRG